MRPIATDMWRGPRYPAKTAGPIEMPFGMWGGVGHSNHVLDEGLNPPGERAIFGVGKGPSHSKV